MQCGAHNKRGGICRNAPVTGRTRCRLHGGKSLVGTACPHYRSGRYSAYVPERLRERYEAAEDDAELLSLRSELALTDARLMDLLARPLIYQPIQALRRTMKRVGEGDFAARATVA